MRHTRNSSIALLITAALLASARVNPQAHGPSATEFQDEPEVDDPTTHAARLEDMDTWLKRMSGRFRLSSAINSERPGLLVDCVGVGKGPGMQCMTGRGGNTPNGEQANASMQLFGLDPLALTVSRLTVNGRGVAQFAQGKLRGDTLVFARTQCALPENIRSQMISCEEILKIRALSSGEELQFINEMIIQTRPQRGRTGSQPVNSVSTTWMKRVPQTESTDSHQ